MEIKVTLDGESIGKMQSAEVNMLTEYKHIKNGDNLTMFSFANSTSYSINLKNVQLNKEYLKSEIDKSILYKVVGTGYKLPRGNKLPKRKRIRQKWKKKYSYGLEIDNVYTV
ncbi:hypothetical protein [Oceanobacillus sp. FSL H7-0719]|uniref:hypothetical protein n=1 Tax=Oceanobacillus sp. FSL H7-0719 TaxID=2954507 RepID=UPI0032455ACF